MVVEEHGMLLPVAWHHQLGQDSHDKALCKVSLAQAFACSKSTWHAKADLNALLSYSVGMLMRDQHVVQHIFAWSL